MEVTVGGGENPNVAYKEWVEQIARPNRFGPRDRIGTANHIDASARRRAVEAMRTGTVVPLARPLALASEGVPAYSGLTVDLMIGSMEVFENRMPFSEPIDSGADVAHIGAHGQDATHIDGINHIGLKGTWYGGWSTDDPEGPSVEHLSVHGLFTRGVLVDIPAVRGTDWVDEDRPVSGADIDAALEASGAEVLPGDALLLYMGRDRYEAAGKRMDLGAGHPVPGAGRDAGRWVAEHDVSMVCWDFLDAVHPSEPVFQLHMLIWAIGLVLVDNCDLSGAARLVRETGSATGGLVVSPPPIPTGTGSLVQPLFIQ